LVFFIIEKIFVEIFFEKIFTKIDFVVNDVLNVSTLDIQKVKFFLSYESIEECLLEIEFNKGIIKENDDYLDLVIPLNSKKYPKIIFPLLLKQISDSEKIQELYDIINNINEEKNILQKKLQELEKKSYHEITFFSKEEEPKGISIDLNCFEKEDFDKIIDKELSLNLFCNLKDDIKVNDAKNLINKINKDKIIKDCIIKMIDDKAICLNFVKNKDEKEEKDEEQKQKEKGFEYLNKIASNLLKNMKLKFKTDLQIKDLFELKTFSDLFNKATKCHFILKGISIEFKLFLLSIIDTILIKNENEDLEQLLYGLKIFLSLRETFIPDPEELLQKLYEIINKELNEKNELDKQIELIPMMIKNFFDIKNNSNDEETELIKMIDWDNLSINLEINGIDFGVDIKLKIKEFNETMKTYIIKNE
jgi:hypothetical protein